MKFADLHLHTDFSDGTYTPEELIGLASQHGLSAIAVADHDTVEGIAASILAGQRFNIEVLPAIELSAEYQGSEVHILGYLIDYKDRRLLEKLNFLNQKRIERIREMVKKLSQLGIAIDYLQVEALAGKGTIGRLHLARVMVRQGCVKSISEAFQKYISDKGPAYVCGFHFTPQEAVDLIRSVKGISVLAHPYTVNHDELIPLLIEWGIQGLEAYYPEHSTSQTVYYENLAAKYNLLVTGGSDCHGKVKPKVKIGSLKVPYELVERLKNARKEN